MSIVGIVYRYIDLVIFRFNDQSIVDCCAFFSSNYANINQKLTI